MADQIDFSDENNVNRWYTFTDQYGNEHVSRGDNWYIQQSVNSGIPIYVDENGDWFTEPYVKTTPTGLKAVIPEWFTKTNEYSEWLNTYVPQINSMPINNDTVDSVKKLLKGLGSQGAFRIKTYNEADSIGVTDPIEKQKLFDDTMAIINEGYYDTPASLDVLQDVGEKATVADIARKYKSLSKEDLSKQLYGLQNIINAKGQGKWDQKTTREAYTLYKLLNAVADDPDAFGKDKEFEGLLEASEWQKFQTHIANVGETITENIPLFQWAARLGAGLGAQASGKGFDYGWNLSNRRKESYGFLNNETLGTNLRGTEGSAVSGMWAGTILNMGATMATAAVTGNFLGGALATTAPGTALANIGTFSKTFAGGMVFDFFANDLPIDFSLFLTDLASGKTSAQAWEDKDDKQPLFGLFGPNVNAGLKYNLIGDALMDVTMPIIGIGSGAMWRKLDDMTGGAVTKIRNSAAINNLKVQQKFSDMPVIGKGLQKFSNFMFGPENAALIREGRKAAIIQGSMTPYTDVQNLITLKNHYGAEVVAPMYKKLTDDLNITEQIKEFRKNANNYGGMGKVQVEWNSAKAGVGKQLSETVNDDIPRQVKRGLLDYQRLEELKGEVELEGGIMANPKRQKEIAELEKRVEALPDNIKKFAENFSELNKRVEQMGVALGLTTQQWIDALAADPRWKNYMTRQVLVPGGTRRTGSLDPATNKLLTGKRTGYYNPDQTLSPVMSLDMKVHALGNAYAWNERAKALVAAEMVQGKITAGGDSVELAKKIAEKREMIAMQEQATAQLGYEAITKGFSNRLGDVSAVVKSINDKLSKLDNITVKSTLSDASGNRSAEVKGFVSDFETGKVTFADGVKENLSLSDNEAAAIIQNTYKISKAENGPKKIKVGGGEDVVPVDVKVPKAEKIEITNPLLGQDTAVPFKLEMFHGSGKPASEIYVGAQVPVLGEGKYWAFSEGEAKNFGDKIETETVSLERPLIIMHDDEWRSLAKQAGWKFPSPVGLDEATMKTNTANLKKLVTDSGYDGIIVYVGRSEDGLLKDVFSIDQVVVYKNPEIPTEIASNSVAKNVDVYDSISQYGAPIRYTVEDNKITSMEVLNTPEALSQAVAGANPNFHLSIDMVNKIGEENAHAVARAAIFYRDNFPDVGLENNFFVKKLDDGVYGQISGNPIVTMKDDKLYVPFTSYLATDYYAKENQATLRRALENDVKEETRKLSGRDKKYTGTWHPKNSNDFSNTPIHESAHTTIMHLALLEANEDILAGYANANEFVGLNNRNKLYHRKTNIESSILSEAASRMGEKLTDDLRVSISLYAAFPRVLAKRNAETIAEALTDYAFNGVNAAPFSQSIVHTIQDRMRPYGNVSVDVSKTLKSNGLDVPSKLVKDGQFAFPDWANTNLQKAKWLDKWRKDNPYIKGELTEDTFQKANKWDSFMQQEINRLAPDYATHIPDALATKAGQFIDDYQAKMARELTDQLKKLSGGEIDSDLAMMIIGRNGDDIAKAMDNYILRQVDISAEELAKNMEGGLTPENLNTARITLWSDESTKEAVSDMLNALVPEGKINITEKVNTLFDQQAKGLAAYEALPLDSKALIAEKDELVAKLYAENKKTMKLGEKMDKNSDFRDGGTHIIHYKEGGEDVYVTVNDPVIASILEKPYNFKEQGMIVESLETIANFVATTYRLGTTGLNPIAFLRNVLRDPIQAMVTGGFNPLSMTLSPEVFYKTLKQYGLDDDTIQIVTDRIRNWSQSGTMTQEMRLGPGKNTLTYRNEVERMNIALRKFTGGKIVERASMPLETWEGFLRNQIGQQSFVKNYRRTGDVNKAMSSALFDSSNVTTNFSHAIGKWKWATSTVPYLSSAINGTVSFWRLFNTDPLGMIGRITAGFMVPVMAITAWNLSSKENRGVYETLDEWYKASHLVLVDPQGNVVAFPLPEEIQNFYNVARQLIEFTQDATPYAIPSILAQGAFGFLPVSVDGYFADDGSINFQRGFGQMMSGLLPQVFTTFYELAFQEDLFTGEDISDYSWWNKLINAGANVFGTSFKNAVNSIGIMCGASEKDLIGLSYQDQLARDLFGMGFHAARNQFMEIVGTKPGFREDGSEIKATGFFAKNEDLKKRIKAIDSDIATASDDEKPALEKKKQELIDNFTNELKNSMDNYQRLFQVTGGLERWQKNKLIQLLTLGDSWSSADDSSYQAAGSNQAYLDERGLAIQRYVDAGFPSGPDIRDLGDSNSIEIQAALNSFYGSPKQATQDYKNAIEKSGVKDIRNEFYSVIQKIYDDADANNTKPDYDMIEKIQARYLQSVDNVIAPIINRYGIDILNNNDFVDAVRRQVNGMIPSDDWRQSTKNAKKFLSTKEFPTAGVDVKKWLMQRYSSGMRDRGLSSDTEVTQKLQDIKKDIDAGNKGSAKGKIESLRNGINKSNYYISATDYQTLTNYYNMVK